jgi:homoserine O-acetyltransferase
VVDNVLCQHRLLGEAIGVRSIALVAGWSLGAIQAYHWAALYPEMVRALLPFCGSASCWPLNDVFLQGVRAALTADPEFAAGRYLSPPQRGLRAFGRAYAGWAYSASFFRNRLYRNLGYEDVDALLSAWEAEHLAWDANDLLAMLWTWIRADIGALPGCGGDYRAGLARVQARTIVMPCTDDQYFTLAENQIEAAALSHAELRPIESPYGHCAGAPGRFAEETMLIETAMRELLCV